jgi:phospholipid-transporting ATPase
MGYDKPYGDASGSGRKGYSGGGDPFEDEEGPSAYSFSAPQAGPYSRSRKGRFARFKEDYLTDVDWTMGLDKLLRRKSKFDGVPREIALNDAEANRVKGYENNSVSTGKYGPLTFLPKFLFCECSHDWSNAQPSSRALPIYSSSSLRVSSRCRMCRRRGDIPPSCRLRLS